jgi:hypothetical protein
LDAFIGMLPKWRVSIAAMLTIMLIPPLDV